MYTENHLHSSVQPYLQWYTLNVFYTHNIIHYVRRIQQEQGTSNEDCAVGRVSKKFLNLLQIHHLKKKKKCTFLKSGFSPWVTAEYITVRLLVKWCHQCF